MTAPSGPRCSPQAVDERLRDRDALALDECRLAVRPRRLDDQVHVRVYPVEPRDLALDQDLLRRVEHRLAVMRERRGAKSQGRCENTDRLGSHVATSERAGTKIIMTSA